MLRQVFVNLISNALKFTATRPEAKIEIGAVRRNSGETEVFDIRTHFGCTDMLVRNGAHGAALAKELGARGVVLMRGHGFVAVGESIPIAVYRAIYTEMNAALQQKAIALGGEVTYLDVEEARLAEATNRSVVERPWQLWKTKAMASG